VICAKEFFSQPGRRAGGRQQVQIRQNTHHINTTVARNGNHGVERSEIDTDDTHLGLQVVGSQMSRCNAAGACSGGLNQRRWIALLLWLLGG
jgi:hypothetical protein